MRRQPGHLKSASQTDFYPQHAPYREAPYINFLETPNTPHATKVWSQQVQREQIEDVERRQRQQKHCELAQQERENLEGKWKKKREQLEKQRKQEKYQAWKRMQMDKVKREDRWTQKTEAHPFHNDLWAEDEELYKQNRVSDNQTAARERATLKAGLQDQADRRTEKLGQIDQLDILRKEKKKLQGDQKELKARLDLDKVDKRCANAKYKADMKMDAHQCKLADMGHLDRSHSDFFTEPRLNSEQIDRKRQRQKLALERSASLGGSRSFTGSFTGPMSLSDQMPSNEDTMPVGYKSASEFLLASIAADLNRPQPTL